MTAASAVVLDFATAKPASKNPISYCPVSKKMGACSGGNGTAVPLSVVDPTLPCETLHSNCVPDNPAASTVNVCPSIWAPAALDKFETCTLVPGVKLLSAWKVATFELIENDVICATGLQFALHTEKGALRSYTSVSIALLGLLVSELVAVLMSATYPASHILT